MEDPGLRPCDATFADLRERLIDGFPEDVRELREASTEDLEVRLVSTPLDHRRYVLWRILRERGVRPSAGEAGHVLGVAAEIGAEGGWALVFGFRGGWASLYTSTGGGMIGAGEHEWVRPIVDDLADRAEAVAASIPGNDAAPAPPAEDEICFWAFTPAGLRAHRERREAVEDEAHRFAPLHAAVQDLITAFRHVSPDAEREDLRVAAGAYASALLTVLAQNPERRVVLAPGGQLPDPAALAGERDQLAGLDLERIRHERLSPDAVIELLAGMTSFGRLRRSRGRLRARLVLGREPPRDVVFAVRRGRTGARGSLELSCPGA